MSVLAYSELLKRITGIKESELEKPFIILGKHNTTENRLKVLRELANHDKATIGFLLKRCKLNKSGGSYLTIKKFFEELEKDGLLKRHQKNKKQEWSFSKEFSSLKEFILK